MVGFLWDRPWGAYLYGRRTFCYVEEVYYFYFLWEILLFPGTLLLGFVLVFAWCVEPLVFGVESAGLFENPTIFVGMVSRLSGSAVYLTYRIQDFV